MSHGQDLIIKTSKIDEDLRLKLLKHPYYALEGIAIASQYFHLQDHFIGDTPSDYDKLVLEFLDREQFDYSGRVVEYWFQKYNAGPALAAHCDYNFIYREKMKLEGDDWPHTVDRNLIVSPMTIALYLEVNNMFGGEIGISHRAWYEEEYPVSPSVLQNIKQHPYILYKPHQSDILYFKGSDHYHWIEPITSGTRKSMLINFWPKELLDK